MRIGAGLLAMAILSMPLSAMRAQASDDLRRLIDREIHSMLPRDGIGGAAVAVRIGGETVFFNYGMADLKNHRAVDSDALFNLASVGKIFDATLLALAVRRGAIALDDPVVTFIPALADGGDVHRFTLGQLATHMSGLLLPQDHPPWPEQHYLLPEFLQTLKDWKADRGHTPGAQHMYTHAGYILLHLALERKLGAPLGELLETEIFKPLGMTSTSLPRHPGSNPRGELDPSLISRAVQGYGEHGETIGTPGDIQGYYLWPGTGQAFSSAHDMAIFLAANLGEHAASPDLAAAMDDARRPRVQISPNNQQALAWEINLNATPIVEKNGGLNNSSTYIGMVPAAKTGIVILSNRAEVNPAEAGRRILLQLVQ
jgi:beta-lactamase class C